MMLKTATIRTAIATKFDIAIYYSSAITHLEDSNGKVHELVDHGNGFV
jgi:hypothetical protein